MFSNNLKQTTGNKPFLLVIEGVNLIWSSLGIAPKMKEWNQSKKINKTYAKITVYTCSEKKITFQNNGDLLPPWFQKGIAPSLFTRWGPLKLCLYWNLTWRSPGTEAKEKRNKNNKKPTLYKASTEAILKSCLEFGAQGSMGFPAVYLNICQALIGWSLFAEPLRRAFLKSSGTFRRTLSSSLFTLLNLSLGTSLALSLREDLLPFVILRYLTFVIAYFRGSRATLNLCILQ